MLGLFALQDNHALLKEIFHRIDPASVSSSSGRVVGEIEISLKYKSDESTLLVKIGRAKNLENVDMHNLPTPFAQAQLLTKRYFRCFCLFPRLLYIPIYHSQRYFSEICMEKWQIVIETTLVCSHVLAGLIFYLISKS